MTKTFKALSALLSYPTAELQASGEISEAPRSRKAAMPKDARSARSHP